MPIDPVILKKINDDIAAAQGNEAALNAALARRAAYLAQEAQNDSSKYVVKPGDDFEINTLENRSSLAKSATPAGKDREADSDIAKVDAFMAKVTATIEHHETVMKDMMKRYNIFADDPDIREEQELAFAGDLAFVPNQQQAAAQDTIDSVIAEVLPKLTSHDEVTEETVASNLVLQRMKNMTRAMSMNPPAFLNEDGTLNQSFQEELKQQTVLFHKECMQLVSEFRAMPSRQQQMLESVFSVLLTTATNATRATPGFDSYLNEQDQGARPYPYPKPSLGTKQGPAEPGYQAPPASTDIPRPHGHGNRSG